MSDFLMEMIVSSARRAEAARERTPLARPEAPGRHGRLRAALAAPATPPAPRGGPCLWP